MAQNSGTPLTPSDKRSSVAATDVLTQETIRRAQRALSIDAQAWKNSIINSDHFRLHNTTRLFATDICDYVCANFQHQWHCANSVGREWNCGRRVALRTGCQTSLLCEAYNVQTAIAAGGDVFSSDALKTAVRCAASASLILACILTNDSTITERQLAALIAVRDNTDRQDGAKARRLETAHIIRRYGYCIFTLICQGRVTSVVPSVQTKFIQLQTRLLGTNGQAVHDVIHKKSTAQLLLAVKQCSALYRRYCIDWLAECCAALVALPSQTPHIIELLAPKNIRRRRFWIECLVDCLLVWLALCMPASAEISATNVAALCCPQHRGSKKRLYNRCWKTCAKKRHWIERLCWLAKQKTWLVAAQQWLYTRHLFMSHAAFSIVQRPSALMPPLTTSTPAKKPPTVITCLQSQLTEMMVAPNSSTGPTNLGHGSYGDVCRMCAAEAADAFGAQLAEWRSETAATMAVKTYRSPVQEGAWLCDIRDALIEINALLHFANVESIVKCRLAVLASDSAGKRVKEIRMAMPLYQCDFHTWIQRTSQRLRQLKPHRRHCPFLFRSLQHFTSTVTQLAGGVDALHKQGFLHRDIKTPNILISDDEKHVVLADFGSALFLYAGSQNAQYRGDATTLWWRAPEHLVQQTHRMVMPSYKTSTAADVWALAICVVEMITNEPPFGLYESEEKLLVHQRRVFSFTANDADWQNPLVCGRRNNVGSGDKSGECRDNEIRWPTGTTCDDSVVYKTMSLALQKSRHTKAVARPLLEFMFEKMLHLNPERRDSAEAVALFFANIEAPTTR